MPFFYSGVSCLSVSSNETDVPLLAFLIPFDYKLWIAIFAALVITAIAAAIFEWFSPFGNATLWCHTAIGCTYLIFNFYSLVGLNPYGRMRSHNFTLSSGLWVMCSLLFSHMVAFKAPKSWPNKVISKTYKSSYNNN